MEKLLDYADGGPVPTATKATTVDDLGATTGRTREPQARPRVEAPLMTHKYRGYIVVLSINKSVEPNEEQKVLTSGFDEIHFNTSRKVFSRL